jgi:hypothetical protein
MTKLVQQTCEVEVTTREVNVNVRGATVAGDPTVFLRGDDDTDWALNPREARRLAAALNTAAQSAENAARRAREATR